jgi:hypothetical protein
MTLGNMRELGLTDRFGDGYHSIVLPRGGVALAVSSFGEVST